MKPGIASGYRDFEIKNLLKDRAKINIFEYNDFVNNQIKIKNPNIN